MKKTLISILLISAVFGTPAFASYFGTNRMGTHLNIGSAPNPKPKPRPIIEEPAYVVAPYIADTASSAPLLPPVLAEVPPPAIHSFVIFFDFDKSNLTVEAKEVVAAAVNTAMATGMVHVVITGHADTVGSQRYNQSLSERRAGAVKTEIVRLGLNARDINTIGKGFSEPLVPTGSGVREPQNRRAIVDLDFNLTAGLEHPAD
jgi:outer membrane protein OmpA-like peptidoglycan-associated protein